MQHPVRGFLHGTAALASLVGTVALLMRADSAWSRLAVLIYGLGLVLLYTTSSLYHAVAWRPVWKRRMQRADHIAILVVIAATYTPVAGMGLDGWLRIATLALAWAIVVAGATYVSRSRRQNMAIPIALQVSLGWLAMLILAPLARRLPVPATVLLATGGLLYTLGMVCMLTGWPRLWPRVFSSHEVFHVLVVLASAAHFTAIFVYLAGA